MSEEKVVGNRVLMWTIVVLVPLAGLGISAYDVFLKKENKTITSEEKSEKKAQRLFFEAKELQTQGNYWEAYGKYTLIEEVYPKEEVAKAAKENKESVQKLLENKINEWVQAKNLVELENIQGSVEKFWPDRLSWFKKQLAKAGKKTTEEEPKESKIPFWKKEKEK